MKYIKEEAIIWTLFILFLVLALFEISALIDRDYDKAIAFALINGAIVIRFIFYGIKLMKKKDKIIKDILKK